MHHMTGYEYTIGLFRGSRGRDGIEREMGRKGKRDN